MSIKFRNRLVPNVKPELEWIYLVNETLAGERLIVPALGEILESNSLPQKLRFEVERQFDEEVKHVRGYHQLVGSANMHSSGYVDSLSNYVKTIPSLTLRLYCLQGLLEGIALGALDHRLNSLEMHPAQTFDRQVREEETGHTQLSFPFFKELAANEGAFQMSDFDRVAKDVSGIFRDAFSGKSILNCLRSVGIDISDDCVEAIDHSPTIREFRFRSARILSQTRNLFLKHYREAILGTTC